MRYKEVKEKGQKYRNLQSIYYGKKGKKMGVKVKEEVTARYRKRRIKAA